jgi:hypothetical protein
MYNFVTFAGIGAGLGAIKGIDNQIYASKNYNGPGYGPGEARADFPSLARSGLRYGAQGAVYGLAAYGALEVAQNMLKKSF